MVQDTPQITPPFPNMSQQTPGIQPLLEVDPAEKNTFGRPSPPYLRVEDEVFGPAHFLVVGVRLVVDARGVVVALVAGDHWGDVGPREVHLRHVVS